MPQSICPATNRPCAIHGPTSVLAPRLNALMETRTRSHILSTKLSGFGELMVFSELLCRSDPGFNCSAQASSSTAKPSSYATASSPSCRIAAGSPSSGLTTHANVVACRRRRSSSRSGTPASSSSTSSSFWCSFRLSTLLLDSSSGGLLPCLFFSSTALCSLLTMRLFLLDIDEILRCALPLGVEDESLIVLRLGENARPCLQ
jgi:hypothetical protein